MSGILRKSYRIRGLAIRWCLLSYVIASMAPRNKYCRAEDCFYDAKRRLLFDPVPKSWITYSANTEFPSPAFVNYPIVTDQWMTWAHKSQQNREDLLHQLAMYTVELSKPASLSFFYTASISGILCLLVLIRIFTKSTLSSLPGPAPESFLLGTLTI